jgi:hypothetical protein
VRSGSSIYGGSFLVFPCNKRSKQTHLFGWTRKTREAPQVGAFLVCGRRTYF